MSTGGRSPTASSARGMQPTRRATCARLLHSTTGARRSYLEPTVRLERKELSFMVIAMLLEFPGMTEEQYVTAGQELQRNGTAAGHLFHAGGPMEGGGIRVVDVWEAQEAADAFYG